ncbi:choice-of-anchor A family protein [Aquabacterium sp. J223]|uniref:choice-of-anchor A family protein n=1 Tax=Aquabacterium sp. J223 TaxID=2898431 RepID=UPI0021ADAB63|nr:choice-of-anchor A family protein [Aquabacterium sp. J223]UUX95473.1 choice-of-anchor A family protein [Aquabacterium sp. J223]
MTRTACFPRPLRRLAALGLLALSAQAGAVPLTAEQVFEQFNLVVFGDVQSSSNTHGRSFVGGNVTGGDYVHRALPASQYAGLTVLGNATQASVLGSGLMVKGNTSGGQANNNNNDGAVGAVLGNSTNTNFNVPSYVAGTRTGGQANGGLVGAGNAKVQQYVDAMNGTDLQAVMTAASATLGALGANSSIVTLGSKAVFTAAPDASGRAVFEIGDDAAFFASINEFEFNLGSATSVFINSDFAGGAINVNFLGGSAQGIATKVIWNFTDATTLSLGREWGGSILAPFAAVTNANNIEGTLVAASLTQRGQLHVYNFTGDLPVAAIPEPSTYALLALGLGLVGLNARRRCRR